MKQFKVIYSDKQDVRKDRYECGPFPMDQAREMQSALEFMDCYDFEIVPVKEAA